MTELNGNLDAALDDVLEAVREQLAEIDRELAGLDARRDYLKGLRKPRAQMLAIFEPKPEKPKAATGSKSAPSQERLQRAYDGIVDTGLAEFSMADLLDDEGWISRSQGETSRLVNALRDDGRIALVRVGERGTKIYELVR